MCGLFGFADIQQKLTIRQRLRLGYALAKASEERGTDATGIAYNSNGKLHIHKKPVRGKQLHYHLPVDATTLLGHTRMTTQGSEKQNRNNHPFSGEVGKSFALAHNGVLQNDIILRKEYNLPPTLIETDSYVAVQLIEKMGTLTTGTIAKMAEQLEGTFTLSLLDNENTLYLVKGNNPLYLLYFKELGLYVYGSTPAIVQKAIHHVGFIKAKAVQIEINQGDIICIYGNGKINKTQFSTSNLENSYLLSGVRIWEMNTEDCYTLHLQDILTAATSLGYNKEELLLLLEYGYSIEEIIDWLDDPEFSQSFLEDAYWGTEVAGK